MKKILPVFMATMSIFQRLRPEIGLWRYQLSEPFEHPTFYNLDDDYLIRGKYGDLLAGIRKSGTVFAERGFAWDGCSPKIKIGDIVIGTPDGAIDLITQKPKTYYGSLVHDILCQLEQDYPAFPLPRTTIDEIFKDRLIQDGFIHAQLYYQVVRWLGSPYGRLMRWLGKR